MPKKTKMKTIRQTKKCIKWRKRETMASRKKNSIRNNVYSLLSKVGKTMVAITFYDSRRQQTPHRLHAQSAPILLRRVLRHTKHHTHTHTSLICQWQVRNRWVGKKKNRLKERREEQMKLSNGIGQSEPFQFEGFSKEQTQKDCVHWSYHSMWNNIHESHSKN